MTDEDEKYKVAVLQTKFDNMKERLDKIEGNQRWVVLAVIGAIIAAIMQQIGVTTK